MIAINKINLVWHVTPPPLTTLPTPPPQQLPSLRFSGYVFSSPSSNEVLDHLQQNFVHYGVPFPNNY